jgi:hypothetical protein
MKAPSLAIAAQSSWYSLRISHWLDHFLQSSDIEIILGFTIISEFSRTSFLKDAVV